MKKLNKFKNIFKDKGNVLNKTIPYIFIVIIFMLSVGWATYSQVLEIDGMLATVRLQANIRITGISTSTDNDFVNNGAISNWEDYNVNLIHTSVSLPNDDSQIKYKIQVTNFGNVEEGLMDITGLPEYLEYSIENYEFKDKICDDNGCKLGTQKDIYIIIKYKDGVNTSEVTDHIIDLNFDFRAFFSITYTGFPIETDTLQNETIEKDGLNVNFGELEKGIIKIKENGKYLSRTKFTFKGNTLEIPAVKGNLEIIYKQVPELEYVLRNNDIENYLTDDLVGDMYRYQGTDDVPNWICFGTTKDCSQDPEDIDKYMYRIMGLSPDGNLVLIKESGVKEVIKGAEDIDEEVIYFQNHYTSWVSDCGGDGSTCRWPDTRIFKRLNGICNASAGNCPGVNPGTGGDTNIFIGNEYYEYLNDNNVWLDLIEDHVWTYGDTEGDFQYNGDLAHEAKSQFTETVTAKIGLQFMTDYYYAYPGGIPENFTNAKEAWIHLSKDGLANIDREWTMSRTVVGDLLNSWYIYTHGYIATNDLGYGHGARPVFYVSPLILLKDGTTGERNNPYIIDMEEMAPEETEYEIEDLSGNNKNLTISKENATLTSEGLSINAGSIDTNISPKDLSNTFSIVTRFKVSESLDISTTKDDYHQVFTSGSTENGSIFQNLTIKYKDNKLSPYAEFGYGEGHTNCFGEDIEKNTFYTITIIYDNGIIKFYNNGNLENTVSMTNDWIIPTNNYRVRNLNTFSDFLIYDRVLTDEEISTNFSETIDSSNVDKQNLLLYYKFA